MSKTMKLATLSLATTLAAGMALADTGANDALKREDAVKEMSADFATLSLMASGSLPFNADGAGAALAGIVTQAYWLPSYLPENAEASGTLSSDAAARAKALMTAAQQVDDSSTEGLVTGVATLTQLVDALTADLGQLDS